MAKLSAFSLVELKALQEDISSGVSSAKSLEEAAQTYTDILYKTMADSVVLARFFATISYGQLLPDIREKVDVLAESVGVQADINDDSMILTLLGTTGIKAEWCSRGQSVGHCGIPLVSSDFIRQIPMMARMLKRMGAGLDWIDEQDADMVIRATTKSEGVFYAKQAKDEEDMLGRKVISAQDFVEDEQVQTVFGIGGGYLGTATLFTAILFLNEEIDKVLADRFMLQANVFKTSTMKFVYAGNFFK